MLQVLSQLADAATAVAKAANLKGKQKEE